MKIIVLNGSLSSFTMVPELCKHIESKGESYAFYVPWLVHSPIGVSNAIATNELIQLMETDPFLPSPKFVVTAGRSGSTTPLQFHCMSTPLAWAREVIAMLDGLADRRNERLLEEHAQDPLEDHQRGIIETIAANGGSYDIVLAGCFKSGNAFKSVRSLLHTEQQLSAYGTPVNRPTFFDVEVAYNTVSVADLQKVKVLLNRELADVMASVEEWMFPSAPSESLYDKVKEVFPDPVYTPEPHEHSVADVLVKTAKALPNKHYVTRKLVDVIASAGIKTTSTAKAGNNPKVTIKTPAKKGKVTPVTTKRAVQPVLKKAVVVKPTAKSKSKR